LEIPTRTGHPLHFTSIDNPERAKRFRLAEGGAATKPLTVEAAPVTEEIAATASIFVIEVVAMAGVGVGRVIASVVVVVANGKVTSAFPGKSIQKIFASVRAARSARPITLTRYGIGRVLWMERTRGRNRFVSR
jgi:hypothetical protein